MQSWIQSKVIQTDMGMVCQENGTMFLGFAKADRSRSNSAKAAVLLSVTAKEMKINWRL